MTMTLAERLLLARTRAGLSQGALAKTTRVSRNTCNRIERGIVTDPGIVVIQKFAKALGVPAAWLAWDVQDEA